MADAEPTAAGRSLTEDEMADVKKEQNNAKAHLVQSSMWEGDARCSSGFSKRPRNMRHCHETDAHWKTEKADKYNKSVLERLRRYLCDKIIAERHFDYLRSKKILSREDTEEISCRTSSRKKAGKLLDYLAEHPKGLDTLIESIKCEKTQNFLLEKITDAVLKAKNEKLESLKGTRCNNCMASVCEQANNLSRSQSNDSNFFEKQRDTENTYLHPEEYSTAAFVSASSLCSMNLPITEVGNMENSVFSTLPGPGDPGAPPIPTELQSEQEEISTTSSDNPFLPLRSRSILP